MRQVYIFEIKGKADGESPYKIAEFIEVEDLEAWKQLPKRKGMEEVIKKWNELCDDKGSLQLFAEKIEPK